MIKISYEKLKQLIQSKGIHILESYYLGYGIFGKFYPPNIILMCPSLCNNCDTTDFRVFGKQKIIKVLLHQLCHYFKFQQHKDNFKQYDEQACFQFEEVVCQYVLNKDSDINTQFQAIERLNLKQPVKFLKETIEKCRI